MRAERVRAYVNLTRRICREHGLEAPITLTSLSNRVFDSTVPLLFARDDESEAARARACFEALFDEGRRLGFLPYRVGVHSMGLIVRPDAPFWRFAQRLKDAVDPGGVLAPGRYAIDAPSGLPSRGGDERR
jgi:4-cresol dehydrogenase (hydroxylating)